MKKCTVLFAILLFTAMSCISLYADPSTDVIARISSRRIGQELQKRYPDTAKGIKTVCEVLVEEAGTSNIETLTMSMIKYLVEHIDDPLLEADIKDLLSLIKIDFEFEIPAEQINLVKTIASGLLFGIEVGVEYGG